MMFKILDKILSGVLFLTLLSIPCGIYAGISRNEDEQLKDQALECYFKNVSSAWKGHDHFANWLVQYLKPKQIVDLGVDWGYSTFVFAKAAKHNGFGTVTGIDWFQGDGFAGARNTYEQVVSWVNEFGLYNVNIIKGDFAEIAKCWTQPIDILHIDGYHSYEAVSSDYQNWSKFVNEKGVILFHDINVDNPSFGIIQFFREIDIGHKLYFWHSYGLGIVTKNKELAEAIEKKFLDVKNFKKNPI